MCGRFSLTTPVNQVTKRFNISNQLVFFGDSNIRPGSFIPVVTKHSPKKLSLMYWGFKWSKTSKPLINIRGETLREKDFFQKYLEDKMCLIPANGFFEWEKKEGEGKKIPHFFNLKNNSLFAFAGVYSSLKDGEGKKINTVAIITTTPNKTVAKIHDRMPVIIPRGKEELWFKDKDVQVRLKLLLPLKEGFLIDTVIL